MDEEIDHEYTEEIVCPHCGYEFSDSFEIESDEEDLGLIECDECGEYFYAYRSIQVSYLTEKPKTGVCKHCGEEGVIEDYNSTVGSYESLCPSCGKKEKSRLMKEYMKTLDENIKKFNETKVKEDYSYLEKTMPDDISKIIPLNNTSDPILEKKIEDLANQIKEK